MRQRMQTANAHVPPPPCSKPIPAVRAALELPRSQPADYYQAIGWLIDLGRPELAKPILDELAKLQISDAQRAVACQAVRFATDAAVGRSRRVGSRRSRVRRCLHGGGRGRRERSTAHCPARGPTDRPFAGTAFDRSQRSGAHRARPASSPRWKRLRGKPIPIAERRLPPRPPKCGRSSSARCSPCFRPTTRRCVLKSMDFCGIFAYLQAIPLLPRMSPPSAESALNDALARYRHTARRRSRRMTQIKWSSGTGTMRRSNSAPPAIRPKRHELFGRPGWPARLRNCGRTIAPISSQPGFSGLEAAGLIGTTPAIWRKTSSPFLERRARRRA